MRYSQLLQDIPRTRRDDRLQAPWGLGTAGCTPVAPPGTLLSELPLGRRRTADVNRWRGEVRAVLDGADDRLLVIAGPCSVHDPAAAREYARWLAGVSAQISGDVLLVMRAYFEKPRTAAGWRGLTTDPGLDGSCDIGLGLREARQVLLSIADAGVPAATEWVDLLDPLYLGDAVSWSAVGARTVESPGHRLLASALPMPVAFKNGTGGSKKAAVNACVVGSAGQDFKSVSPVGGLVHVTSPGNPDCHVVLRGGDDGPNHTAAHVEEALALLAKGRPAAAGPGRRLAWQQRQGPPAAARRRGGGGRAGRRRAAGHRRGDAGGVLRPAARNPGTWPP